MAQGGALAYGVYIQDTANKLWKPSAWNGSATANAIAVYDESCAFLIALEEASGTLRINSSKNTNGIDLTEYTTLATAITDFEGITNTEVMVDHYGTTTSEAAGYCTAYSFPNGLTGYLGSAGEWDVASKYKDAIESALSVVGGESMTDGYYWTSTFYDNAILSQDAWGFHWNDLDLDYAIITTYRYVRPFGELTIEGGGNEGGSGTSKKENKLTLVRDTIESPIVGSLDVLYTKSQYPVASDITVAVGDSKLSYTATISEGETQSEYVQMSDGNILSVTPAEDDTYIYTF